MKKNTRAHGLDGRLVEPDWTPLAFDEVRELLAQFPECGEAAEILTVSPRPFSAASVVATQEGQVFVKRHHLSVRDREGLQEEHRYMAHLHAHGAAVPKVYATHSGETAVETGEWTYEVHDVPAGVDLYQTAVSWTPFRSVGHAHSAGQTLARLHKAAQNFDAPARKVRPLVASFSIFASADPAKAMQEYLAARPALANDATTRRACDQALELLAPFHAESQPLLPALPPLWTHNDLHASNLFWNGDGMNAQATAVIDFGLADRTNAVHDLAHAIERNAVEWLALMHDPARSERVPFYPDHLVALLNGYVSVRPLSAEETAALAPMVALCHAEFALTEADYFLGSLHSAEKAGVATNDYLVEHAKWFRGESGTKLLNALREWAATHPSQARGEAHE